MTCHSLHTTGLGARGRISFQLSAIGYRSGREDSRQAAPETRKGRELFYLGSNDKLMAVAVSVTNGRLVLGEPTRLFRIPVNDITGRAFSPYDVAPDGQRFLLNVPEAPLPLLYIRGIDQLIAR
jgi:hypothetical protein